jgi:hypothetical protein
MMFLLEALWAAIRLVGFIVWTMLCALGSWLKQWFSRD